MEVQIDVVDRANNPPVWDHVVYGPIYIRENLPVGAKVVSVKARSVTVSVIARAAARRCTAHGLFMHASPDLGPARAPGSFHPIPSS